MTSSFRFDIFILYQELWGEDIEEQMKDKDTGDSQELVLQQLLFYTQMQLEQLLLIPWW